jgi:phosphatidylserine/phosphatidylglycerophosphate/cardiolipin synthase-like enzyme
VQENQENKYSTVLTALKQAGAKIAVYTSTDPKSYYIHAKTVLADYGTAQAKLFLGSENFSADSLSKNRELGLIFSDAACMEGVNSALTADFKGGTAF